MESSAATHSGHCRIYLDNAATSWPKPACVYEEVDRYQRDLGAAYGRSSYRAAEQAQRLVERARRNVAELIGIENPARVVFTASGTDSLNTAILGILRPGDHVVTTVCEHNSVLRPLKFLAEEGGIEVSYVGCDSLGFVSPEDIREAVRPNTRLIVVIHASNVTGAIQPVADIGAVVRSHGAFFLVDAAQTLGHFPIDLAEFQADIIAAPGHKGLLAPLGTGVLCLSERILGEIRPLRRGGTGTSSEEERHPSELPHRFEAGNLNIPGLAGLAAATQYLQEHGLTAMQLHHQMLTQKLLDGLEALPGVKIHGPPSVGRRTSVVSLTVAGYDPQELSAMLEMTAGVECRAGLHCAPRMHSALGTLAGGGTLRFSPGWATTIEEIDSTLTALENLLATPAS